MPLISVIVPVYNGEKYLRECLASIKEQTLADFEVLVVNDGSTDASASIIDEFCEVDPRFKHIEQSNGGVSKARNAGIDASAGKYLTFVDADDLLFPKALLSMYSALKKGKAQVCVCSFLKGTEPPTKYIRSRGFETYSYEEAMKRALYQSRLLNSPWGVLLERELLGDERRFREGIRYEDLDAFYRFFEEANRIVYMPAPLYFYRDNSESFMNTWSGERADVLDVTDRILDFFSKRGKALKRGAQDRRFSAHFNILLLMLGNGVADSGMRRRCMRVIREGRLRALTDPNVRLKNKLGAIASFGGVGFLKLLAKVGV